MATDGVAFALAGFIAFIIGLIVTIISRYSGTKIFVFKFSSGIIRLAVGLFSAQWLYFFRVLKFKSSIFLTFLVVICVLFAFVLIPLGIIQIIGACIKPVGNKNEKHKVDQVEKYTSKRPFYILIQLVGFILFFLQFPLGAIVGLILIIAGGVLIRKEIIKIKEEKNGLNEVKQIE